MDKIDRPSGIKQMMANKHAHRNTCGATGSTGWVAALREANRHIEALAVVRKDNSWDMIAARGARDEIIEAMSNAGIEFPERSGGKLQ